MSDDHHIPTAKHGLNPEPGERLARPFERFASLSSSGGIVLLLMTAIAMIWANNDYDSYKEIFNDTEIRITVADNPYDTHGGHDDHAEHGDDHGGDDAHHDAHAGEDPEEHTEEHADNPVEEAAQDVEQAVEDLSFTDTAHNEGHVDEKVIPKIWR